MQKLKVIILDDEQEALDILTGLLNDTGKIDIVKMLNDPLKLESSVLSSNPDAVFTDIQMPNYNGLEILKNLREYNPTLPVVYITAHEKFALEAAKHNPFSYLLKPINRQELNTVIDRIFAYHENRRDAEEKHEKKITLPVKDGMIYIRYDEIFSLTAEGNYTTIKLADGKTYLSSYNLGRLHDQLNNHHFKRINRSTVVNSEFLKEINKRKKTCVLKTQEMEECFELSKRFLKNF